MTRAKAFTLTALTLAFGLMFTVNQAQAQGRVRLRLTKPIKVGNITILPSVGGGYDPHRGRGGYDPHHGHGHTTRFAYYHHVDILALRLAKQAKSFLNEVHHHFRATPQYKHLDHDAHEMEELAQHIHDLAHRSGSLDHMRADVRKLDQQFHHVEDLVNKMGSYRGLDYRAYRHLKYELAHMERTLHDLLRYLR